MADNKTIDNGALTDFTAATDEIGGVDYQYVKLVDGTLDSTTKVGADANGLWVNIKTITAGSKVQLTDGTSDATVRNLAANDALNVAIVDGAGNQVTSFAGSGGTSSTDDADFTPLSTAGTPIMGVTESSPTTVTDNDMGIIGIDSNRRVKVSVDASTLDVAHDASDSGNPVLVGQRGQNALPTAVANNDRTRAISDLFGRQLVGFIAPEMQVAKRARYTTAQAAGAAASIWDPTSGKRIAITHINIGTSGTTAARLILFFAANADLTYTEGTDQLVFDGTLTPTSTATPGAVMPFNPPIFCQTADLELKAQTDAALTVSIAVYGYEW